MRRIIAFAALTLAVPLNAMAHVTVSPRVSKPGAQETYTVRVPTEKQVATTSVDLEVPDAVTISRVSDMDGARHEEKRTGGRVVVITWTKEIKPRERADFAFVATNPASNTEVTWTIRQHYADGSISNWTPATKITDVSAEAPATGAGATALAPLAGELAGDAARTTSTKLAEARTLKDARTHFGVLSDLLVPKFLAAQLPGVVGFSCVMPRRQWRATAVRLNTWKLARRSRALARRNQMRIQPLRGRPASSARRTVPIVR